MGSASKSLDSAASKRLAGLAKAALVPSVSPPLKGQNWLGTKKEASFLIFASPRSDATRLRLSCHV